MELRIDRLSKHYRNKIAVDHFSKTLQEGVYGLLGANGAGKTTLMRMLCDILRPTSGQIFFNNSDIFELQAAYRSFLGYLPQDFGYYPHFTARTFLLYLAALKGIRGSFAKERIEELLALSGLREVADHKLRTYSGGMKQRLGIAQALLNDPKVLILDEPTAGLDPKERVRFRNLISSLANDRIILLSTHIVSDVEYIADEILVMKAGCLVHEGRGGVILRRMEGCVWECRLPQKKSEAFILSHTVANLRREGDTAVLRVISEKKPANGTRVLEPTLEDLYLFYFGEEDAA